MLYVKIDIIDIYHVIIIIIMNQGVNMGLFKSKEQKAYEKKMIVKKSMREMEKRIVKLQAQESKYINAAQIAMREGLPDQVALAKTALKMSIVERKRTYKMLLNAEIIMQTKEMTSMTTEFLGAVQVLTREIVANTGVNVGKIQNELSMAMNKVSEQSEALEEMLEDSNSNIDDISRDSDIVSDEDIDKLIAGGTLSQDTAMAKELENIKKSLE